MMCFKLRHGYLELCMFVLDIPVTQMYVPGTLNDVEHVLVDVGTGYYVEKVKKKNCNLKSHEWIIMKQNV